MVNFIVGGFDIDFEIVEDFLLCFQAMSAQGFWRSLLNSEAEKGNQAYQRVIAGEAAGCWKLAFNGASLSTVVQKFIPMDVFVQLLIAYQKHFEDQRKMMSWRLDDKHLRLLFLLFTRTRLRITKENNKFDDRGMSFGEFLACFSWMGPPTLSITKEMPPGLVFCFDFCFLIFCL